MAQWKIQRDMKKAPEQHRAQLKVTATAEGIRLESAYPFRQGSMAAESMAFGDGAASLELSRAELQQVRAALGAGLIHVNNETGLRLEVSVAISESEEGQPLYQLTLQESVDDEPPEIAPLFQQFPEGVPRSGLTAAAVDEGGRFVAPARRARGAVVSSDHDRPSKPSKKRGRPRGKRGRPPSVRPPSA